MLVFCYCILFHHFYVYVENFPSYVPLHLYLCWYGLRLSDLNKETTYLLTYVPQCPIAHGNATVYWVGCLFMRSNLHCSLCLSVSLPVCLSLSSMLTVWFDLIAYYNKTGRRYPSQKQNITWRHLTDGFHIVYSTPVTHLPKCRHSWTGEWIAKCSVRRPAAIPVRHPRV